jgi:hypothetical protein
MPSLLSGSLKNSSAPGGYAAPSKVQYQLGPTPTTSTGYTLISSPGSQVSYVSSLGNLQFSSGTIYSNRPNQNIELIGTDSSIVVVSGGVPNENVNTGALVIQGGLGVRDTIHAGGNIVVNSIIVGQPFPNDNNSLIFTGAAVDTGTDGLVGQNSIAIGYDTLDNLQTGLNNIAIGRYALSTGTFISNNIAIGDSSLKKLGTIQYQFVSTITSVTTSTAPVVVTSPLHGLTSGTQILISGIVGTTELNFDPIMGTYYYYVNVIDNNTVSLFSDLDLLNPVDGTSFGTYLHGGEIDIPVFKDGNIAVGNNSAISFLNGNQNFFLGNNIATQFTTGSYNFFIGHEVANNMTSGNANISIGGDNLVNGVDNQINIGSVFYYNGGGYLQLNADTGLGLGGISADSTSGALVVYGGAGISANLYVGTSINVGSTSTLAGDVTMGAGLTINNNSGHNIVLSPAGGNVTIIPTLGGTVNIEPTTIPGTIDNIIIGQTTATQQTGSFTHVYSQDGGEEENNLLYTPRVVVGPLPPSVPRVGDFWINSDANAQYQYIQDGTYRFWLQIAVI